MTAAAGQATDAAREEDEQRHGDAHGETEYRLRHTENSVDNIEGEEPDDRRQTGQQYRDDS